MKSNAIVRIVLFSIGILVLLSILAAGLLFRMYLIDFGSHHENTVSQQLPVSFDGITTQGAVNAADVSKIEIEWVAGSLTICPAENTDLITITEYGNDNEKYNMVYSRNGNTLKIQFCKDPITFPSFGINSAISKDLIVTVPIGWICDTLEIDTASAHVYVNDLTIHEFDFDGASGVCSIVNCHVDEIDLDTASGDVTFTGTLDVLDCDAASASCRISVSNIPRSIDIDTASGDLDLTLPDDCGFTCAMETLSGKFSSDFETSSHNGVHTHGNGSCRINVDAMSGDVTIRKMGESAANITEPYCNDPTCTDKSHGHGNHH